MAVARIASWPLHSAQSVFLKLTVKWPFLTPAAAPGGQLSGAADPVLSRALPGASPAFPTSGKAPGPCRKFLSA